MLLLDPAAPGRINGVLEGFDLADLPPSPSILGRTFLQVGDRLLRMQVTGHDPHRVHVSLVCPETREPLENFEDFSDIGMTLYSFDDKDASFCFCRHFKLRDDVKLTWSEASRVLWRAKLFLLRTVAQLLVPPRLPCPIEILGGTFETFTGRHFSEMTVQGDGSAATPVVVGFGRNGRVVEVRTINGSPNFTDGLSFGWLPRLHQLRTQMAYQLAHKANVPESTLMEPAPADLADLALARAANPRRSRRT